MQVEKIHDIRDHVAAAGEPTATGLRGPKRIGVLNFRATRLLAFIIIATAVVACAVICVAAVWEYVVPDFAWRALASLGIISAATAIFVSLNEGFGPLIRE
jgi:formate hydrogenlyase subunit 3/multisubunit Na+/H+ antiporter MnhD subunit